MKIINREWTAFQQTLHSYISRRVRADYVDDLVSEVLLRLVQNESSFKTANKPAAWMYRVATNVITDHYRRQAREQDIVEHREFSEEEFIDNEAEPTPQQELSRCLIPLMESFPPHYREAIQLVDIEGLPQAEAAHLAGLSLSGMKSRVQRGRLKLKQRLLDCCAIETNKRGGIVDYAKDSECC